MKKLINEIITDIRKEHKLSRKGMENLGGFKERTIIGYERGEREVSDKYIDFLSLYFGYKEEYIRGLSNDDKKMDNILNTLLMYQSIYDYDDKKMEDLLDGILFELCEDIRLTMKYEELKNTLISGDFYEGILRKGFNDDNVYSKEYSDTYVFRIAETLSIKPSIINGSLNSWKNNALAYASRKKIEILRDGDEEYYEIFELGQLTDKERNEELKEMIERENKAEKNGIGITPEYYANIIKKRNQPKENYTPTSELNEIAPKYKEILELLPFAPDSFIATLTDKLRTLKETQQL